MLPLDSPSLCLLLCGLEPALMLLSFKKVRSSHFITWTVGRHLGHPVCHSKASFGNSSMLLAKVPWVSSGKSPALPHRDLVLGSHISSKLRFPDAL